MDRKIHSIQLVSESRCFVHIDNGSRIFVDTTIGNAISSVSSRGKIKFARRSFTRAKKIEFELESNEPRSISFGGYFNDRYLYLCRKNTIELLGVGRHTKKFSVWVRGV